MSKEKKKLYLNQFDDSFKIKLPFIINEQQRNVVHQIDEFVHSDERTMTVSGWAGTGKTTLMEIVAKRYWFTHRVQFAATTHKAAGVLRSKVGKSVSTVNSLFGINVETNMDGDYFDVSNKKNTNGDEKLKNNSIVIIDEASMLSEQNYAEVIRLCEIHNSKVIFVGDSAQLSPVNEDDISIVFRDKQSRIVELTKVERTDDNSILDEATNVRMNGNFSYVSKGNVNYINCENRKDIMDVFDRNIPGLENDPNYFRILTYTNKNVEKLNSAVRNKLGYEGSIPRIGEPMMSYSNWGYLGGYPTTYSFINSEAYTCGDIIDERDEDISSYLTFDVYQSDIRKLHIIDMMMIDALGKSVKVPFIDVKSNDDNYVCARLLSHEKVNQWNKYRNSNDKLQRLKFIQNINAINDMLFVNDNIRDENGYLLQEKVIDFGYAHTIHKSQGSTFKNVLINDIDIENCLDKDVRRQLRYVGITRASESASIITNK